MARSLSEEAVQVFLKAVVLSGEGREEFIERECQSGGPLREEVDRLLKCDQRDGFLESSVITLDRESVAKSEKGAFSSFAHVKDGGLRGSEALQGRYRIEGELGRGAMGIVYRVWDERLGRSLALKSIRGTSVSYKSMERLEAEARLVGRLGHPGVVPVYEYGLDSVGAPYFTMPIVDGVDFTEIIRRVHRDDDGWDVKRAVSVLVDVGDTLSFAHSRGVVHRDLKPDHIKVGEFGEVRLLDWGISRVGRDLKAMPAESGVAGFRPVLGTSEGEVMGTPNYMSPEQASGENHRVGPLSDVYALGAVLYHLLSGKAPYESSRRDGWDVVTQVQQGSPSRIPVWPLSDKRPEDLIAICDRAMRRDPVDRYGAMQDFVGDLRAYVEGRLVSARGGSLGAVRRGAWKFVILWLLAGPVVLLAWLIFGVGLFLDVYRDLKVLVVRDGRGARASVVAAAKMNSRTNAGVLFHIGFYLIVVGCCAMWAVQSLRFALDWVLGSL